MQPLRVRKRRPPQSTCAFPTAFLGLPTADLCGRTHGFISLGLVHISRGHNSYQQEAYRLKMADLSGSEDSVSDGAECSSGPGPSSSPCTHLACLFPELDYRNSYEIEYMEKLGSSLPVSSSCTLAWQGLLWGLQQGCTGSLRVVPSHRDGSPHAQAHCSRP